jgi:hypothetical protein
VADLARKKHHGESAHNRLELARAAHRRAVAEALCAPESHASFELALDNLAKIHEDLSSLAKNPLEGELGPIIAIHARWILNVDAVAKLAVSRL